MSIIARRTQQLGFPLLRFVKGDIPSDDDIADTGCEALPPSKQSSSVSQVETLVSVFPVLDDALAERIYSCRNESHHH